MRQPKKPNQYQNVAKTLYWNASHCGWKLVNNTTSFGNYHTVLNRTGVN